MQYTHQILIAGAAALMVSTAADAQCTTIDFENYPVGTIITSQYDGVTFDAYPGSCGGYGSVQPIIIDPTNGTSSENKSLSVEDGCPEWSIDYLRMIFDTPQRTVSFTLGEPVSSPVTFYVRAYNEANTIIFARTYVSGEGIYSFVQIFDETHAATIKRVEVESPVQLWEGIDDLSFNADPTPPEARIDWPTPSDCLCDTGDPITVTGIACDDDGEYDRDRLEYRPRNADPGDPWILIREYVGSPVCTAGPLYPWDLTDVPHGWINLRMTVTNACGDKATDFVTVYVDKAYGTVNVESPAHNSEVCGTVVFQGSVNDSCGHCSDYYTVGYSTSPNGPWIPVDPANPQYTDIVINGNIAEWNTVALGLTDGTYYIRVHAVDECGNYEIEDLIVHLNNAGGCGCQADLTGDGIVDINDIFAILGMWGVCP